MTLSRSMALKILAMTLSIGLLSAASLWGLFGLREDLRVAHDEFIELGLVREASVHAGGVRGLLEAGEHNRAALIASLDGAIENLNRFLSLQDQHVHADALLYQQQRATAAAAHDRLQALKRSLPSGPDSGPPAAHGHVAALTEVIAALRRLAFEMDRSIAAAQHASTTRLHDTALLMAILSAAGVLLTILINVSQYRAVIRPLRRLREGVRRVTRGNLNQPLEPRGATEFAELSADFNQMARELANLYCDLEHKVMVKSRELVRSERLASVGYLAAGVAHEINNPLNIITGHAELSLRQVERMVDPRAPEIADALRIIREEGFRCKAITEKLLSLARTSNMSRQTVEIAPLARDVVQLVRGLKEFRDRRVGLVLRDPDPLAVWGNESELKQVLLNLIINALQAAPGEAGEVVIEASREGGSVTLEVRDNGRGISPEALEHVFEPFFADRPFGAGRGTGLGLSITYAIVEAHGGRITAESAGLGQGSRFTVHFPGCAVTAGKVA